ncbi:hypothetical protein HMPREF9240_01572 [Winkia neuii BV029A5]|uniref:TIGR00374 family protein n=2 Tax=Winkia neuii TaxID=33007 RepID=K0ZCD3_9ACTO|nr:hypothetical protein HMPREF9240_01572 [Winkia neuii BV029A5]PLB80239.1 TIGR00374 family protein [Actinomyces sp. UMB0138]
MFPMGKAGTTNTWTTTLPWVRSVPPKKTAAQEGAPTTLIDSLARRVHRPDDLVQLVFIALLAASLVLISMVGTETSVAITSDVQHAASRLQEIVYFPLRIVENALVLAIPVAVLGMLAFKELWRLILEAVLVAIVSGLAAWGVTEALALLPKHLLTAFAITEGGSTVIALNVPIAALVGMITCAGERSRERVIALSWTGIWITLFIALIQNRSTLSAALLSVAVGRIVGLLGRYAVGVVDRRAKGAELVGAIRSAGLHPKLIRRLGTPAGGAPQVLQISTVASRRGHLVLQTKRVGDAEVVPDKAAWPSGIDSRHYVMEDVSGKRYEITVLDSNRNYLGWIERTWDSLRLRGLSGSNPATLRGSLERATMMASAATAAGVHSPRLVQVGKSGESALMIYEETPDARPLATRNADPREKGGSSAMAQGASLTEEGARSLWRQLRRAHAAGLAHRNITPDAIAITPNSDPAIMHWEAGEIAASELNQRVDLFQMLVVQIFTLGWQRALDIAKEELGSEVLRQIVPVTQRIALPSVTSRLAGKHKLLGPLREELLGEQPEKTDVQMVELTRFNWKRTVFAAIGVGALVVVAGSLNIEELKTAITGAKPGWIIVATAFAFASYVGAALNLKYLTPEKLPVLETTLVQVAASVVALVAPSGVGPAALNLRYLQKKGVAPSLGVATVALVQAAQFVFTVAALAIVIVITGQDGSVRIPGRTLFLVLVGIAAVVVVIAEIGPLRKRIMAWLKPWLSEVWPRIVWAMADPKRIALSALAVLLQTACYVGTFGACLMAFGHRLPIPQLTVTFLTANTLGSVIPTPGGLGPVEAALTGGLQVAGIPGAIALSTAMLYRLLTYWLRVPFGWVALKYLQRKNTI